jgi:hypothetical protein
VWSVFAALYGVTGAVAGLLPGTSAGFTVAVTRFGHHSWAKGTLHCLAPVLSPNL